jgi:hypothetical protein
MTSAAPSQWRRRNDDACFVRCDTMRTAGHACGHINFVAVQCGVKVTCMPPKTTDDVSPNHGATS